MESIPIYSPSRVKRVLKKSRDIVTFHGKVARALRDASGQSVSFRALIDQHPTPQVIEDWARVRPARQPTRQVKLFFESEVADAKRAGPSRQSVLPVVAGQDVGIWWTWEECWLVTGQDQFDLVGVGLVFRWGSAGQWSSFLRAEWDAKGHRNGDVGQPHWHIDRVLTLTGLDSHGPPGEYDPYSPITSGDPAAVADEYDAIANDPQNHRVNLSRAHLYMGGWRNGSDAPAWWQPKQDDATIIEWAGRTLQYVKRESSRISAAPFALP